MSIHQMNAQLEKGEKQLKKVWILPKRYSHQRYLLQFHSRRFISSSFTSRHNHHCKMFRIIPFYLMFLFVPTGTEEARTRRWSGLACVRGSRRVPDSPEFGSFIMEEASSTGKKTTWCDLSVKCRNSRPLLFQVVSDFHLKVSVTVSNWICSAFRTIWQ